MSGMALLSEPLQARSSAKKSAPDQPSGNLYDMKRLLRNLETIKTNPTKLNQPIMIYNIKKGQLSFRPTPDDVETLRKAGASDELIQVIYKKAGLDRPPAKEVVPPFAPEPPKPREGRLTVTCKPLDCAVFVDGKEVGTTTNGQLKDLSLPEGKATVSATVKDHIPDKQGQVIDIEDNATVQSEFAFTVDPNALMARGSELFDGMITALGGESALKESAFFRASGDLDVFDPANNKTQWPFAALISLPAKAKLEISRYNKNYTIVKTESGFTWHPARKGKEFDDLEDALCHLTDYHITGLVDLLRGPGVRVEAEKLHSEPGEDKVFTVAREAYKYRVTLTSESLPKEILLESGGLNAGLKVLLSKYTRQGAAVTPMMTEVLFPAGGLRGFIVRYESMAVNPPGVVATDFNLKKGGWLRGR